MRFPFRWVQCALHGCDVHGWPTLGRVPVTGPHNSKPLMLSFQLLRTKGISTMLTGAGDFACQQPVTADRHTVLIVN